MNPCRAPTVEAARDLFWKQGDFGYVRERLSEMKTLCAASRPVSSLISSVSTEDIDRSQQEHTEAQMFYKHRALWTECKLCM